MAESGMRGGDKVMVSSQNELLVGSFGEGLGWLAFGADTGVLGRFNPQLQTSKPEGTE